MVFAVFLPLLAAVYILAVAVLKRKTYAWEIGTAVLAAAFFKTASMAFKNFFHGKVYSAFLMPFMNIDGVSYSWRLHLERTEVFLAVFIVFAALASLAFSREYMPADRRNKFVVFLLSLTSCAVLCIGSKNMFQFFAGWELCVLLSYLMLMLFHKKQIVRRSGVSFMIWHMLTDIPLFCAFFMMSTKTGTFFIPPFIDPGLQAFPGVQASVFAVLLILGVSAKLFCFGAGVLASDASGISVPALAFSIPAVLGGLGIYVLYIFFPFVSGSETVRNIFIVWGALTALGGLLTALALTNVKALLCSLLMSQFGFILAAFGLAGANTAFHSYFALMTPMIGLILCTGTVIYSLQGEEDILHMGMLKNVLPFAFWTMGLFILCCTGFPRIGTFSVLQDLYAAVYVKGGRMWTGGFAVFSFFLSAAFGRLMYYLFFAPSRISAETANRIVRPVITMVVPLAVLLGVCLFQDKVFAESVLPDLDARRFLGVFLCTLFGCCGLPAGVLFLSSREFSRLRQTEFFKRAAQFCARGFYLANVFQFIFVRPTMALARLFWFHSGTGIIVEKIPAAISAAAEKLQEAHTGKLAHFLVWSLAGLSAMIFSLMFFSAGG